MTDAKTRAWTDEEFRAWLEKSLAAQGLPLRVEDPRLLARVRELLLSPPSLWERKDGAR